MNNFNDNTDLKLPIDNDPAKLSKIVKFSYNLKKLVLNKGPCQPDYKSMPNIHFPVTNGRHFRPEWFVKTISDGTSVRRAWMSYSLSEDKVYCILCMISGEKNCWTTNGFNSWKKATLKLISHETSYKHIEVCLQLKLIDNCLPLLPALEESNKTMVATNRFIVNQLVDITIYLARHCLAFRRHRENWKCSVIDVEGNFKDLVILLAKYSPSLAAYITGLQTKKKCQFTFVSWMRQNQLIESTAKYIRGIIVKDIKVAKFFSISMDTTFDNSKKEQLSFVLRYINEAGIVNERLLTMKECSNTTGQYLFTVFEKICDENGLDWKHYLVGQSYDGASNMRGTYQGVQSLIKSFNSAATYVWCYAHRLNLVLTDAVSCSYNAKDMFGIVEVIYEFISSSKNRVAIFENYQRTLYPGKQIKRFKRVQTTRWWSHDLALRTVISTFDALIETLTVIEEKCGSNDRKSAFHARSLRKSIISDRFLLTALTYIEVFDIITPLSNILQAKDMDLLGAVDSVFKSINSLQKLRNDSKFTEIINELKEFKNNSTLNIEDFKPLQMNRKKVVPRMYDEKSLDDAIDEPLKNFKVNTYYCAIDLTLTQMKDRFSDISTGIFKDLSLFSRRRIKEIANDTSKLPSDAFLIFSSVYEKFVDRSDLIREYIQFSKCYFDFEKNKFLPTKLHSEKKKIQIEALDENYESDSDTSDEHDNDHLPTNNQGEVIGSALPTNGTSMAIVLQVLRISGLSTVFPSLHIALKISLTLPVASVTTERSFSKLSIVKNKLRSTMNEDRLDSLMIIACEPDIHINNDDIINEFSTSSPLLLNALGR